MGIRSLGGYAKPGSEGISYAAVWAETGTGAMEPSALPYGGTGIWYGDRMVAGGALAKRPCVVHNLPKDQLCT